MAMVAGHLREVKGYYHIVLSYVDSDGKRKTPSKSTGLPVKGNKKRAEAMLTAAKEQKEQELEQQALAMKAQERGNQGDVSFDQFMRDWLSMMKGCVEQSTYGGYSKNIKNIILPYYNERYPGLKLCDVTPKHLQDFYSYVINERKSTANTAIHYHANIRKALQNAYRTGMLPSNPADRIQRPKILPFTGSFYSVSEAERLLEAVKGDPLEFGVMMALYYGLRRSEVVGLKWSAVDFENKRIRINHVVTVADIDGKTRIVAKDRTKTKSSTRTMPLIPKVEQYLLRMKTEQEQYKKLCGKGYCTDYSEYIYVNQIGELVKPDYLSTHFHALLEKNHLRVIRFHDLRHSCASLLLSNGVPMKQIQEWLGHSNYSTTANIYAHLDSKSKEVSAETISKLFSHT